MCFALFFVVSLCGCNMEQFKKNEQYVSDVKELVNESVNYTRKLKKLDEDFVCHDSKIVNEYIEITEKLMDIFQKIQKLQPTNEFDDKDKELKEAARNELTIISQIRNLVLHANQNGDDTIYQREKTACFEEYKKYYDQAIELSSEIQTYWRNA